MPPDGETTAGGGSETGSWGKWQQPAGWWGAEDDRWYPDAKPKKLEKHMTQRLMEKGLVPLAAFDVIRGWMLLEMMAFTDTEKNLIKASTQNKLDYRSVSQALRAQWGDRSMQSRDHKPHSHSALWTEAADEAHTDDWTADAWESESWSATGDSGWQEAQWNEHPIEDTKDHVEDTILVQLKTAEDEAANLYNEAQISLQQARDAVAEARKDRGYGDSVQQGQPRGPPTFTPSWKGKGKSKGSGNDFGKDAHFG